MQLIKLFVKNHKAKIATLGALSGVAVERIHGKDEVTGSNPVRGSRQLSYEL